VGLCLEKNLLLIISSISLQQIMNALLALNHKIKLSVCGSTGRKDKTTSRISGPTSSKTYIYRGFKANTLENFGTGAIVKGKPNSPDPAFR
jgi:hypothetical protein